MLDEFVECQGNVFLGECRGFSVFLMLFGVVDNPMSIQVAIRNCESGCCFMVSLLPLLCSEDCSFKRPEICPLEVYVT